MVMMLWANQKENNEKEFLAFNGWIISGWERRLMGRWMRATSLSSVCSGLVEWVHRFCRGGSTPDSPTWLLLIGNLSSWLGRYIFIHAHAAITCWTTRAWRNIATWHNLSCSLYLILVQAYSNRRIFFWFFFCFKKCLETRLLVLTYSRDY